jgi:hypothetical protein
MEQQPQTEAPQPGSQSPLHWLAEMMPDLAGEDPWLLPHQDLAADPMAHVPDSGPEAVPVVESIAVPEHSGATTGSGRATRKRQRAGGEGSADGWDSSVDGDDEVDVGCGRRGGARKKGVAAKEQKKVNEKARRQRENEFIAQLAQLLDPARAGRADKLSTLADAVKEITRLRTDTAALQRLNKILEERVADLKARSEYTQNVMPGLQPPAVFMQQMQQMQQQVQAAAQQAAQQEQAAQQAAQAQQVAQQQPQMQAMQTGFGAGMVALPAAAFQQMLAAHQARLGAAHQAAAGTAVQAPAPAAAQFPPMPAFKAPGAVDVLSSAACLYMPSADLDVSADSVKRPPAA